MYCDSDRDEITPQLMVELFADYCNECDSNKLPYNWDLLWDIAFELKKDWTYIPRSQWRLFATNDNKKELVCELFVKSPKSTSDAFDTFVENYWSWNWANRRGGQNNAYKFLKSVLGSANTNKWEYTDIYPSTDDLNNEMNRLKEN